MGSKPASAGGTGLDKKEIDSLLKFGAYDLFHDDDKNSQNKFNEEDIDQILERSSRLIQYAAPATSGEPSTFSRAVFQPSSAHSQVDINAANFWDLVLPEVMTAHKLLVKLSSDELANSSEQQKQFWNDLVQMVKEVYKDWEAGTLPKDLDSLISLLDKLSREPSVLGLTDNQKTQVISWLDGLRNPRRKRKTSERFATPSKRGLGVHIVIKKSKLLGDANGDYNGLPEAKEIRKVVLTKPWTTQERRKFQEAFLAFGVGRWEEIKLKAGLDRPTHELTAYARGFLQQCLLESTGEDYRIFQECLDTLSQQGATEEVVDDFDVCDSTLTNSQYIRQVQKKVRGWSRRMRLLKQLNQELAPGFITYDNFQMPPGLVQLATWWTAEHDKSLLFGAYKHGLDSYESICNDPDLAFYGTLRSIGKEFPMISQKGGPKPAQTNKPGEEQPAEEEEKFVEEEEEEKQQAGNDQLTDQWPTRRKIEHQIRLMLDALKKQNRAVGKLRMKEYKAGLLFRRPDRATSDWSKREIKSLRAALMACGGGDWALLRARGSLNKSDAMIQETYDQLMEHCRKVMTTAKPTPKPKIIKPKTTAANTTTTTTTTEPSDSQSTASQPESADDSQLNSSTVSGLDSSVNTSQLDNSRLDTSVSASQLDNSVSTSQLEDSREETQEFQIDEDPQDDDDAGADQSQNQNDELEENAPGADDKWGITTAGAGKLVRRVELLEDIRFKIAPHPDLAIILKAAPLAGMPRWWSPSVHDLALLQAVSRYGVGLVNINVGGEHPSWTHYLEDPNCPFWTASEESTLERRRSTASATAAPPQPQTPNKGHREKFLLRFLQDKQPLIDRLKLLRKVVQQNTAPGSLDAAAKENFYRAYRSTRRSGDLLEPMDGQPLPEDEGERLKLGLNLKLSTRVIPRDGRGRPILPITAKGATIHSLGTIIWDNPNWSSKNYLWPCGFSSSRMLPSIVNRGTRVVYTSTIEKDEHGNPLFAVTPEDSPEVRFTHNTASGAWMRALMKIKRKNSVSVSGPEMYGFSDPTIKMLIQELPNARKCAQYIWKDFEGSIEAPDDDDAATTEPMTDSRSDAVPAEEAETMDVDQS